MYEKYVLPYFPVKDIDRIRFTSSESKVYVQLECE